jgi:hypothetical protein
VPALLALILVTAIWGVTFVQIKDALELYPLFAFSPGGTHGSPMGLLLLSSRRTAVAWAAPRRDAAPPAERDRKVLPE